MSPFIYIKNLCSLLLMVKKLNVGVDIGGTKTLIGLVDQNGKLITNSYFTTNHDAKKGVDIIKSTYLEYKSQYEISDCINISLAAFISLENRIVHMPNLNASYGDIKWLLKDALGVEIRVVNDANAAAWCEFKYGNYIDNAKHMVSITLGTGVGSGMVLNSMPYTGRSGIAAELGHMIIDSSEDALHCNCGKKGCWESYASGTRLTENLKKAGITRSNGLEFSDDCFSKPEVRRILYDYGRYVAIGLINIERALNPQAIVIGGGVSRIPNLIDEFIEPNYRHLAYDITSKTHQMPIISSRFRGTASLIGAATYVY